MAIYGAASALSPETALTLEFVCTCLVLFVGVTLGFDKKRFKELGISMVCVVVAESMALAVFVSITVTGRAGYAGVGLNPARCLAPALLQGGRLWEGHWVFWVGPFFACVACYCFSLSLSKEFQFTRSLQSYKLCSSVYEELSIIRRFQNFGL